MVVHKGARQVDIFRHTGANGQERRVRPQANIVIYGRTPDPDTAEDDTKWKIWRVVTEGGIERTEFADREKYTNKWSDYATLFPPVAEEPPVFPDPGNENFGTSAQYTVTAVIADTNIPAVADKDISRFLITCNIDEAGARRVYVSIDGGTNVFTLSPGDSIEWFPKAGLTQIAVSSNSAGGVVAEAFVNFEP